MAGLPLALGFLTAIPIRTGPPIPGGLGRAAVWFPVVGVILGVLLSLADWLLASLFPPLLVGALIVALWAALTGGLHLDGLSDSGDGLLSVAAPERRLEIMRDPRLGAFGVLSLVLFVSLKLLAVASLAGALLWHAARPAFTWQWQALLPLGPLVLATVAARWLLVIAARQPSARPGGLGSDFAAGLTPRTLWLSAVLPIGLALLAGPRAILAIALAALVTAAVLRLAYLRLGGVTGDILGLVVELSELTLLLTYAAAL